MSVLEFIDTNILVYADDARNRKKQRKAQHVIRDLLRRRQGIVSLQVLQEYFAAVTRKLGIGSEPARQRVVLYSRFDIVTLAQTDLLAAIDLHRLHQVSIWDALILRAALNANCSRLLTEDLQHGWTLEGLTVVNPFAD